MFGTAIVALSVFVGSSGDSVLAEMDKVLTLAQDQVMEFDCITESNGAEVGVITFQVFLKGTDWRRVEFKEPGNVRGMKILTRAAQDMYVYLPAFKKVRRLASHVKEQGFMGTAFGHEEMSLVRFGPLFTGNLKDESDHHWLIEAVKRPDVDSAYSKLLIEIRKDLKQPAQIQYFDSSNRLLKTEKRLEYGCRGKVCAPRVIQMIDHSRGDLSSKLVRKSWMVNTGVPDTYFSLQSLRRGN